MNHELSEAFHCDISDCTWQVAGNYLRVVQLESSTVLLHLSLQNWLSSYYIHLENSELVINVAYLTDESSIKNQNMCIESLMLTEASWLISIWHVAVRCHCDQVTGISGLGATVPC